MNYSNQNRQTEAHRERHRQTDRPTDRQTDRDREITPMICLCTHSCVMLGGMLSGMKVMFSPLHV